ncbi:hypothetical protein SALBM311S_08442 [Streptomyces alboniger]
MGLECGRFDVVEEAESVGTDGFVLVRARRSRSRRQTYPYHPYRIPVIPHTHSSRRHPPLLQCQLHRPQGIENP